MYILTFLSPNCRLWWVQVPCPEQHCKHTVLHAPKNTRHRTWEGPLWNPEHHLNQISMTWGFYELSVFANLLGYDIRNLRKQRHNSPERRKPKSWTARCGAWCWAPTAWSTQRIGAFETLGENGIQRERNTAMKFWELLLGDTYCCKCSFICSYFINE